MVVLVVVVVVVASVLCAKKLFFFFKFHLYLTCIDIGNLIATRGFILKREES